MINRASIKPQSFRVWFWGKEKWTFRLTEGEKRNMRQWGVGRGKSQSHATTPLTSPGHFAQCAAVDPGYT